jgi:hypothetical protein
VADPHGLTAAGRGGRLGGDKLRLADGTPGELSKFTCLHTDHGCEFVSVGFLKHAYLNHSASANKKGLRIPWFFNNFLNNFSAACLLRRRWTSTSIISHSSTMRQSHIRRPSILLAISFKPTIGGKPETS